jgi:hypothetical protein
MKESSLSEESLRHFLLGNVDDDERQRIEILFLTDPETKERLLAAEQSLLDDYLDERLAPQDEESFLSRYAAFPDQRERLSIEKAIKDLAEAEARPVPVAEPSNLRQGFFGSKASPKLILRIAAVVIVGLLVVVWLQSRRNQPDARHLAVERELASLNDPSRPRETSPQTFTLAIAPVTLRDVGAQAQFTPRADVQVLELHLLLGQKEAPARYRAIIQRAADSAQFRFPEFPPQADSPNMIRLWIPTSFLTAGDYKVIVSSLTDGTVTSFEEYNFTVSG